MVRLGLELKSCGSRALSSDLILENMSMLECTAVGDEFPALTQRGSVVKMKRLWLDCHTSISQSAVAVNSTHIQP